VRCQSSGTSFIPSPKVYVLVGDPALLLYCLEYLGIVGKIVLVFQIGRYSIADSASWVSFRKPHAAFTRAASQQLEADRTVIIASVNLDSSQSLVMYKNLGMSTL
jgi:hypothetical protein